MRENKQLASRLAVTVALATLVGTSAFAESRRSNETSGGRVSRGATREGRIEARGEVGRGNESRNRGSYDRNRSSEQRRSTEAREGRTYERRSEGRSRTEGRTYERRSDSRSRSEGRTYERRSDNRSRGGYNRNDGYRRNDSRSYSNRGGSHHRGQSYYHHGRISNYHRYGNGYRVWIAGAPYPFFVPLAYWRADRFRIGLSIGLGGYWNPGGYYDYYDGYRDGYRDSSYRERTLNSEADFEGVVESVDYRRDTFVVRNERTGNYVTVVLRDRREGRVREGDYVAVRGDWTTRGVFHAYDVDILD